MTKAIKVSRGKAKTMFAKGFQVLIIPKSCKPEDKELCWLRRTILYDKSVDLLYGTEDFAKAERACKNTLAAYDCGLVSYYLDDEELKSAEAISADFIRDKKKIEHNMKIARDHSREWMEALGLI